MWLWCLGCSARRRLRVRAPPRVDTVDNSSCPSNEACPVLEWKHLSLLCAASCFGCVPELPRESDGALQEEYLEVLVGGLAISWGSCLRSGPRVCTRGGSCVVWGWGWPACRRAGGLGSAARGGGLQARWAPT